MRAIWSLTFLFITGTALCQPGKVVDKIIAVVGNEIILHSELETSLLEMTQGKTQPTSEMVTSSMEQLLYQKLLLNQSKLDSLEVSDAEVTMQVDRRINYFIQMFGSVAEFEKYYGKSQTQLKEEYFDLIRDQLLVQKMQDQITRSMKVTPAEVLRYYQSVPTDSIPLIGEQLEYSKIEIKPKITDAEKDRLVHVLDSIRTILVSGKSSMTLEAAKWSDDPGSKYKGGCYELQRKGTFVPEYEAAVANTPEGSYSPVFSSAYGYHFVKVIEKRGDFYKACHILMAPEVNANDLNLAQERLSQIITRIGDTLTFEKAARMYSTDEESKNQGGKVINLSTGGTRHDVASLTSEMNLVLMSMKEGELSTPILVTGDDNSQSYAFYRLDRRIPAHPANMKDDYDIFKQVAEANARRESTDKWVKKKIADTSIQIDEEYRNLAFDFTWVK
jgi:peptidyl-prolyl cis-trans isomerase SurA